ncbi:MAG: DUF4169 family protein [Acidisphaera sp.]|nr:DUF4169 family protein [Acidisphaera sp.]MBV9812940.1 DUF4169 family protein [Acetobacteraceae bacterium]
MGEIVNLKAARKRRQREAAAQAAAATRAKHGQTKTERQARALERKRADKTLDGAKTE